MQKSKCDFRVKRVKFLGYELRETGIEASSDKVESILEIGQPKNVTELKSFLGMVNYHSKFIKGYKNIVKPLYNLLKAGKKWQWTQECKRAFSEAKNCFSSRKVLMPYDTQLPGKLTVDALPYGVGAVFPASLTKALCVRSHLHREF